MEHLQRMYESRRHEAATKLAKQNNEDVQRVVKDDNAMVNGCFKSHCLRISRQSDWHDCRYQSCTSRNGQQHWSAQQVNDRQQLPSCTSRNWQQHWYAHQVVSDAKCVVFLFISLCSMLGKWNTYTCACCTCGYPTPGWEATDVQSHVNPLEYNVYYVGTCLNSVVSAC